MAENAKNSILIVEDDPFLAGLAAEKIQSAGYDVSVASDADAGMKVLEKKIPDLILLDILLPGINGFEFLKNIKKIERFKDIPVVIFSNLDQERDIAEGRRLGADDFLVKVKFTPDEVVRKIAEVLRKRGKMK